MKILVAGAGGFIGGHLANRLLKDNNTVIGVDIKPLELWFHKHDKSKNYSWKKCADETFVFLNRVYEKTKHE